MFRSRIVARRLTQRLPRTVSLTRRSRNSRPRNRRRILRRTILGRRKMVGRFQDPELQALIRTALKNNYDVRIAATRVLQAQAQLGITRADQLPSVSAGGNVTSQQNPKLGPIPAYEITQGEVAGVRSWNLDFWGKYRRATEAARANLLANEWAQKEVMATLVANLATCLLSTSPTGSRAGDLQAHVEFTQRLAPADANSGAARHQLAARRAAVGATGLHRRDRSPRP